jgi:TnpA family transposase
MDQAQRNSRIVYPKLAAPLMDEDLRLLFTIQSDEWAWARSVARRGPSMVALLTQLKIFQHVGRFLPVRDLPSAAIGHVANQIYLDAPAEFGYDRRTLYRHHRAIREYLGITPWGAKARGIASTAIATAAEARLDPADLINSAIDALIRERCELPLLSTLDTLAGTAHRTVNAAQWHQLYERLSPQDIHDLDALLTVNDATQESPFAVMCRGAGKPTRDNLKALITHYNWIETLVNPVPLLAPISEAKVAQWANEARRLKARELREYVAPRRYALLLAALRSARGRLLDELTAMLIKFSAKIIWRSEQHLEETSLDRGDQSTTLIATLAELLDVIAGKGRSTAKISQLDAIVASNGGCEVLQKACADHAHHNPNRWQPFAYQAFAPYRSELLLLGRTLPLTAARPSANNLIEAVGSVVTEPTTSDYYIVDLDRDFLPPEWRELVGDREGDVKCFNRRHLEVVTLLELADAIKAGAIHVTGSLSHDDFWGRLPAESSDPNRVAAYAAERGWPKDGAGFANHVRDRLVCAAEQLDREVSLVRSVRLDGTHRRPVLARMSRVDLPDSAAEAARQVIDEMPERSVLEALSNTAQWVDWPRHFGLPSQMGSAIENIRERYLITTFAYGCGLGATQAARHFAGAVSADDLSFVDRRHVDIADLRAGSADLQNLYAQFELTKLWGTGESAAADGTHFETFRNNLLAAHHFRYGKTGGIVYRHISDNYIALFSRFIGCGVYEATYILDILQHSVKKLRPTRLHADTHGQSAHVFGLAFLLGIELLPRIRSWKKLKLYHPGVDGDFESIEHLFSATANWHRIEKHYADFIRLALAIHSGQLAPSAVLARINSQSSRDSFSLALQDLGNVVRTTFLLRWSSDEGLRREVHKGTTKVERSHQFAKYLNFGGEGGMMRTNNPAEQEKAIVYNELVTNAVALQTVADQTNALHELRRRGIDVTAEDLSYFSPYPTSKVKRFGEYPARINAESALPNRNLPARAPAIEMPAP